MAKQGASGGKNKAINKFKLKAEKRDYRNGLKV